MTKYQIYKFGIEVFNKETDKFRMWFLRSNFSLGGYAPQELMHTEKGQELVYNCLCRIEYGNMS